MTLSTDCNDLLLDAAAFEGRGRRTPRARAGPAPTRTRAILRKGDAQDRYRFLGIIALIVSLRSKLPALSPSLILANFSDKGLVVISSPKVESRRSLTGLWTLLLVSPAQPSQALLLPKVTLPLIGWHCPDAPPDLSCDVDVALIHSLRRSWAGLPLRLCIIQSGTKVAVGLRAQSEYSCRHIPNGDSVACPASLGISASVQRWVAQVASVLMLKRQR